MVVLLTPQPGDLQETTVRHCKIHQEARHACAGKRRDETASRQVTPALVSSARPFRHNINRLPQPGQDPHATERRLETSPRGDPTLQITRGQSSRKMTDAERQWYIDPERLIQWDERPWCCNGVQCTPRGVCARRNDPKYRATTGDEPQTHTGGQKPSARGDTPQRTLVLGFLDRPCDLAFTMTAR